MPQRGLFEAQREPQRGFCLLTVLADCDQMGQDRLEHPWNSKESKRNYTYHFMERKPTYGWKGLRRETFKAKVNMHMGAKEGEPMY